MAQGNFKWKPSDRTKNPNRNRDQKAKLGMDFLHALKACIKCHQRGPVLGPTESNQTCRRCVEAEVKTKTPVTLGQRSHRDLDRHHITVQNTSIAVEVPWHRHETRWNRLERRLTAFVFCRKFQMPWDRRHSGNAVQSQWQRSTIA
jgi:hypothetical protein